MIERYNRPILFYSLSLIVPWVLWFLAAYLSHNAEQTLLMQVIEASLGIIGLIGPALIAVLMVLKDKLVLKDLLSRLIVTRGVKWIYYLITLTLIFASIVVAQLLSLLGGHSLDQFVITGSPTFTSAVFSPWFILLFAPIVEEIAWHSYGTDTLRRKLNLMWTSIIFSAYWVIWHLPLSFIKGYYHAKLVSEGPIYAINFVFSLFVFVILMNWLYYKTKRNIFVAIAFHLTANVSNEIFSTHPDSKVIQTGILLVVAIIVLIKDRDLFFSKKLSPELG